MTTTRDVDFFGDPELARDPYDHFDELVRTRPVYVEPHHGVVMVSGLEEALAVFRDPDTFSNATIIAGPAPDFGIEFTGDDITEQLEQVRHRLPISDQIVTMDPPVHTAHRALLMGLITPARLRANEEFIRRLTDRQLDVVMAHGRCELVDDYAQPYSLLVVADLLGVPEDDHPMLLEKAGIRAPFTLGDTSGARARNHHGLEHLYDYFSEQIARRRSTPRDDVLTGMAQARFPDGTVPAPIEVARIASNLFAAGQETTVRLLATAFRILADDPQLQQRLRADPTLVTKFVEETLRTEGPIKGSMRLARRTTTLGGVEIKAGMSVFVMHGAAGRDPRQFTDPAEFRIDRPNVRRHVGFGHGPHTCPGAPLARSEVRVTVQRMLERTSDIRLAEQVHGPRTARRYVHMPSYMFRGLTELHLEFTTKD